MTTSCISCVHASPNPQVYALNDRSRGLKTSEHVSSLNFFFAKIWRSHRALESALIPLVMLLTCKAIPKHRICEEKIPRHRICEENIPITQNSNDFIIQREMFTGLFEGATSNRAELDYKTRHNAPRRESLSFIYDSYMQYHEPISWVLLIPSI